jgi:biopolymer transport protein TolR
MAFRTGSGDDGLLGDINVTPLVDVMLVLLIIFMVTAPMLHQGMEVVLPKADAKNLPNRADEPLVLSINRNGQLYLGSEPVHPSRLIERLRPLLRGRAEQGVLLKGDREAQYGSVIEVLDLLQRAGIDKVGVITQRPEPAERR